MEERTNVEEVTSTPDRDAHRLRDGLMWTAGLGLLLVAIGLAVPDLREVLGRVARANLIWLGGAVALEVASCLGYVAVVRLVLPHGPARPIRWLAWTEMAFGAVVPVGGAGGLAVGAWAMRAWGVTWSRIANRSAVIFLLTSAVNAGVLALSGLAVLAGIGSHRTGTLYGLVPTFVGVGSIGIFLALPRIRSSRLRRLTGRVGGWVTDTEAVAFTPNPASSVRSATCCSTLACCGCASVRSGPRRPCWRSCSATRSGISATSFRCPAVLACSTAV